MYVYLRTDVREYVVGFYKPEGTFYAESTHDTAVAAAERVNFLNGQIVANISNECPMIQPSDN